MHSRPLPVPFLVGIVLLFLLRQVSNYTDLNLLTISKGNTNFSRTKILFNYPGNPAIIWDQHNKLYRIYGGIPDSINVINSTRTVIFTEPVILKSNADSIEIGQDYARYKGYLGIWTDERKFLVDAQGEVSEIQSRYPQPEF